MIDCPGASTPARWSSVTRTSHPPGGGSPAHRDVAAEARPAPHPRRHRRPATRLGRRRAPLAVAPRSRMTPRGTRTVRRRGSSCIAAPALGDGDRDPPARRRDVHELGQVVEVTVVAEREQRPADGRIDVALGQRRRSQGRRHGLEQQRAHPDRGAGRRVQRARARSQDESASRPGRTRRSFAGPRAARCRGAPDRSRPRSPVLPNAGNVARCGSIGLRLSLRIAREPAAAGEPAVRRCAGAAGAGAAHRAD